MRGLANRSEGAGAGLAWALLTTKRGCSWGGLGPVDKSERLGIGLAWVLSIKGEGMQLGWPGSC